MKSLNNISGQAARLKKIRLYLGMTRHEFSEAIKISQFTLRSWENGKKNFTAQGVERVIVALEKKIKFKCSFEWLMAGVASSPISLYEDSTFQKAHEIHFDSSDQNILKEVATFKNLNKKAQVLIVSDNRFLPLADIGDYLGLIEEKPKKIENYVEKIIFQNLSNDEFCFGIVHAHRRNFYLKSLMTNTLSPFTHTDSFYPLIWLRKRF